ncbi:MAG: hypothetical protein WAU02_01080 [Candidatus Saccharimonadales bacterium]
MNTWQRRVLGGAGLLVVGGVALWVYTTMSSRTSFVPEAIHQQLTFTTVAPKNTTVQVETPSIKYDTTQKILTFTATYQKRTLVITEQPLPQEFIDVPPAFDKFATDAGQYDQFDSAIGSVRLTKLPKQPDQQAAIIKTNVGVMMFIKPSTSLTPDEWRQLVTQLDIER